MLQNETQSSISEYTSLRRGKSEMPDMLYLWNKIKKEIPTDSIPTVTKDDLNEIYEKYRGRVIDLVWYEEQDNLSEEPKKKNIQHGPIQKGKKGKLKRW